MKKCLVILGLVLIMSSLGVTCGFSQYYDLDGKWVQINGPEKWKVIGIALDEPTCDTLIAVAGVNNRYSFPCFLKNYNVLRIPNGSSALVLDIKLFEGKAKVMVFKTLYERESGWIPISWLDGNQDYPTIENIAEDKDIFEMVHSFH